MISVGILQKDSVSRCFGGVLCAKSERQYELELRDMASFRS